MATSDEVLKAAQEDLTRYLGVVQSDHAYIHDGIAFIASDFIDNLAAAADLEYEFIPGTGIYMHVRPEKIVSIAAPVEVSLYAGCTPHTGTVIDPRNYNQASSNESSVGVLKTLSNLAVDVTVTAGGVISLDSGTWADYPTIAAGQYLYYDDDGTSVVLYVSAIDGADMTVLEADGSTAATLTAVAVATAKTLIFTGIGGRISCDATDTMVFATSDDSVTLASGHSTTFRSLGFRGGDQIYVVGTTSNNGLKTIEDISANGLVMNLAENLTDETINSATDVDFQLGPDGRMIEKYALGTEGRAQDRAGGADGSTQEIVIPPNTTYMIRVKNIHASAASDVYVNPFWYEETQGLDS